jgi:hypothetical protein
MVVRITPGGALGPCRSDRVAGCFLVLLLFACATQDERGTSSEAEAGQVRQQLVSPDTNCVQVDFNGSPYWFCGTPRTWSAARARCQSVGMDLVRIDDAAENQFVWEHASDDWWLGANDLATEGTWVWSIQGSQFWSGSANGTAVGGLYSNWKNDQPNDLGNEDCAQFTSGGKWRDDSCADTEPYVCEYPLDLCPDDPNKVVRGACGCGVPDTDSDKDGAPDCIDHCPNDATKLSPGDCGCLDAPKPTGTPCGDGLCSANTACNGAGTCGNPSSCPRPDSDCRHGVLHGDHYWFCDNDRSFTSARQRCQNVGMDLVVIETAAEDAFISSKIHEDSWIGGSDQAVEGAWMWLGTAQPFWEGGAGGTPVEARYSNWKPGQPSENVSGTKDCAVKDGEKWQTQTCTSSEAFVCEDSQKLRPLIPCVRSAGGGAFEAHFGYENRTGAVQAIFVGSGNSFAPAPLGRGQPQIFQPQRVDNAFAVVFDGSSLAWTLSGRTVVATASSPTCPSAACGNCGEALTCSSSGCVSLCGDGLCGLGEACNTCPADCGCPQGEVCTQSGGCGVPARCGIDWECGAGVSFGVAVDCGACPPGKACIAHACE